MMLFVNYEHVEWQFMIGHSHFNCSFVSASISGYSFIMHVLSLSKFAKIRAIIKTMSFSNIFPLALLSLVMDGLYYYGYPTI